MSATILDLSATRAPSVRPAPKIAAIHPAGSMILVEFLTAQELQSSNIILGKDVKVDGPPQAYVLEVGPNLPEAAGIRPGQRLLVQGTGVGPLPNFDGRGRERMLLEYNAVKGIIEESN